MPMPPRGDPRRRLHLAVRSMWVLGVLLVAVSVCGVAGSLTMLLRGRPPITLSMVVFQAFGSLFYLVPGIGNIVCAIYLKQRQFWALVAALVLNCIELLFAGTGLATLLVVYFGNRDTFPRAFLIGPGIMAVAVLAVAQVVYLLARSFAALRLPPYGADEHGFEPIGVRPITQSPASATPVMPIQSGTAPAGEADGTPTPR